MNFELQKAEKMNFSEHFANQQKYIKYKAKQKRKVKKRM